MRSSDRSVRLITSRARAAPSVAPGDVVGRRRATRREAAVATARAARHAPLLVEPDADTLLRKGERARAAGDPAADHRDLRRPRVSRAAGKLVGRIVEPV